jgi:hypothetical protein
MSRKGFVPGSKAGKLRFIVISVMAVPQEIGSD